MKKKKANIVYLLSICSSTEMANYNQMRDVHISQFWRFNFYERMWFHGPWLKY